MADLQPNHHGRFSGLRPMYVLLLALFSGTAAAAPANPIMFAGQVPTAGEFATVAATFGNQQATLTSAPRGGGLFIRYPDGTVKDLTAAAGYGKVNGLQGATSIAVRDPSMHWSGRKALFSMAIGSVTQQFQVNNSYRWQIYVVNGLGKNQTPVITKVANQPTNRNNIYPFYDSNSRILFVSDAPVVGNAAHLYPPLDEYELSPINSGIRRLSPSGGVVLNHAPSGDFKPFVDSFGRIIFSQWDHLQRDQQADADALGTANYGTFNYSNETRTARILPRREEVFPEPRSSRTDLLAGTPLEGHNFNQFFPWQMNQDGTGVETVNHVGRQEFGGSYMSRNRNDDPAITEDYGQYPRFNKNRIINLMQISESPQTPGLYYAVDAPEFGTFSAGQIVSFTGGPQVNANAMSIAYMTHRDTAGTSDTPGANHSGLYRDPLGLSDGTLVAAHTAQTRQIGDLPAYSYDFRIKTLKSVDGFIVPDAPLTNGISRDISWWSPDTLVTYQGNLWELSPVEVKATPVPPVTGEAELPAPEQAAFTTAEVDLAEFKSYLTSRRLALIVSRNVTTRDSHDKQQPYSLRVPGGERTAVAGNTLYNVAYFQAFQANMLRGYTGGYSDTPRRGRRVLATPMNTPAAVANNPSNALGRGITQLSLDGSMAQIVPARRAMTWQLNDPAGAAVVRERYWLTFQPGEVRVCASCHGVNTRDQTRHLGEPTNTPQALTSLLQWWKLNKQAL